MAESHERERVVNEERASKRMVDAMERLVDAAQELSLARDLESVMGVVKRAARELTGADGATFILRDGDLCFYADEDAIAPLWKGHRFPMTDCVSGWAMLNRAPAVIEDIYSDPRVPADAYRPTFVKSLAMVPIRTNAPIGAIGNYWAVRHQPSSTEVRLLQSLADLTSVTLENIQLYTDLQARIADAQQAIRARDEFLSIAAHELRTPLTALQLQLQTLDKLVAQTPGPDERLASRTVRAVANTQRLALLIEQLLDVSRISLGRLALNPEAFELVAAVREVAERFLEPARRAGSTVAVSAPGPIEGVWDRFRVEQVITNLLSNAIKYGAGKPIEVAVNATPDLARIEVHDHGIGLSPDDARRIFERFERAVPVQHYGGLGLGLYICKQVVEAHGGTIWADGESGASAKFVVELPRSPAPAFGCDPQ